VLFPNFLKECSWCGHSYLLSILEVSRQAWGATPNASGSFAEQLDNRRRSAVLARASTR
jgi:hypothetical protein